MLLREAIDLLLEDLSEFAEIEGILGPFGQWPLPDWL